MEDVARAANVSTATVSRVLNTPDVVAPETAARVLHTIDELGYKPNFFAQGLTTRKSKLLGLLLPDIHGEFYSELIRGADAEARRLGYLLIISSEHQHSETPLLSSNAVGLIGGLAVMLTEPNPTLWAQALRAELPLVVIDKDLTGKHVDRVLVDNRSGASEAAAHLLTHTPAKDCYFIGGPKNNFDTEERAGAFVDTIDGASKSKARERVRYGEYTVEWGRSAGAEVLAGCSGRPSAILAGNDDIALGILQAAADVGVEVPAQLRVVGFDDARIATLLRPQLSSVRVPMTDVGASAVRMLVNRIAEPERLGDVVRLPARLVVRGSSRVKS